MFVQQAHEDDEVDLECCKPISKLDDVQASLAALDLADGRLCAGQQVGKIRLPYAMKLAVFSQERKEDFVLLGM